MTQPEKKKLPLDEQIRLLEQRGAYLHYPEAKDPIRDTNLGSATSGPGVTSGIVALRDQDDNKGQAGAGARQTPLTSTSQTGDQSRDNPNARTLQTNVPPSQLGGIWREGIRVPIDDIDPRTSSVSPPSPKPIVAADAGNLDTGTSLGRGNDPSRSAGPRIPPISPGSTQLPEPSQIGGSNTPQSSIKQLPSATLQEPGIQFRPSRNEAVVPTAHDSPVVAKSPGDIFNAPDETPGTSIHPLTAGGEPANDPRVLKKTLARQLMNPVEMPDTEEPTENE